MLIWLSLKKGEEMSEKRAEKKNKVLSAILFIGLLAIVVVLIWELFGDTIAEMWDLISRGDQQEIAEYISRSGELKGLASLLLISILQVISIFFPGMVIQVAGSLIYPWWKAFLACYFGFVLGNTIVFLFARRLGNRIDEFLPFDLKNNWLMDKINSASAGFVIGLACMVPGIPNGSIPYIAAKTAIRPKSFVLAVAATSWVQILCNCICGHYLVRGDWLAVMISMGIQIALIYGIAKNHDTILQIITKIRSRKND